MPEHSRPSQHPARASSLRPVAQNAKPAERSEPKQHDVSSTEYLPLFEQTDRITMNESTEQVQFNRPASPSTTIRATNVQSDDTTNRRMGSGIPERSDTPGCLIPPGPPGVLLRSASPARLLWPTSPAGSLLTTSPGAFSRSESPARSLLRPPIPGSLMRPPSPGSALRSIVDRNSNRTERLHFTVEDRKLIHGLRNFLEWLKVCKVIISFDLPKDDTPDALPMTVVTIKCRSGPSKRRKLWHVWFTAWGNKIHSDEEALFDKILTRLVDLRIIDDKVIDTDPHNDSLRYNFRMLGRTPSNCCSYCKLGMSRYGYESEQESAEESSASEEESTEQIS